MPTEIKQELIDEAQRLANRAAEVQFLQANFGFFLKVQRRPEIQEKILDAIVNIVEPLCPKLVKPTIVLSQEKK